MVIKVITPINPKKPLWIDGFATGDAMEPAIFSASCEEPQGGFRETSWVPALQVMLDDHGVLLDNVKAMYLQVIWYYI